jgi:hypothetical protein
MAKFRIYLLYHIIYWDNKLVKRIIYIIFKLKCLSLLCKKINKEA